MRNNNEYFKHGFINSMANLQKRESKLPMNVWIDPGEIYKKAGHGMRVKVQLDHEDKVNKDHFVSIALDGSIVEKTFDKQSCELNNSDIKKAK